MKRWLFLFIIIAASAGALLLAERQKAQTHVGPEVVLGLIADTEQEMSRLPARLTRISDEQEIRIGDEMAQRYLAEIDAAETKNAKTNYNDQLVQSYVERVGTRVSLYAHRKLPYRFHYVPDPNVINAFALPGGHVFIGRGMLDLMTTEDQLASVLGHEVEHIDLYHCAERVQLEAHMRKLHLEEINGLVSIPVDLFKAGYSKDQELDADRAGTRLAMMASYSPEGAISMFRMLGKLCDQQQSGTANTPEQEVSQLAMETLKGYFESHPPAQERIEQIEKLMRESPTPPSAQRRLDPGVMAALHRDGESMASEAPARILH
ncbi:MAG TPA: M48 family metalloprotease [Terriglobales bacterium]|jgi:predicted Zn-dependent protease|nr:M48 family metalloprotease [Terriglobales bacterium]